MIPAAIKNNVRRSLESIADENYQRQSWFGTPVMSDIGSVYEFFAYDGRFLHSDGYLNQANLNSTQRNAALIFAKMVDEYYQPGLPSELVIDDPEWQKIRIEAQKLLPILFPEDAARYAKGQWHEEETGSNV